MNAPVLGHGSPPAVRGRDGRGAGPAFRAERWAGDSDLSCRLLEAGETLWFEPRARITHLDHGPFLGFLRQHRASGRDFGLTRAERRGWGRGHCLLRALGAPLVPFVMTARIARRAAGAGAVAEWALSLPAQLLALSAWGLGEAVGLLDLSRRS